MYAYHKDKDNNWLLCEGEEVINSNKDISIAYTETENNGEIFCSILKHGNSDEIESWKNKSKPVYESANLDFPVVVKVDNSVPEELVNFVLGRTLIKKEHFDILERQVIEADVIKENISAFKI